MKLKIINSNSEGNCYILENNQEALLIECGVRFDRIKQALNFNLSKLVGCVITHDHKDHCRCVNEVLAAGIEVFASEGTHSAMGTIMHHRAGIFKKGKSLKVGGFKIIGFDVKHDAADPLGFLIHHEETGNILFLTDSYYCEYTFPNLHNVIIEANYCQAILNARQESGSTPGFLRDRVIESHMSLATCKDMLQANDLSLVNNIVLIHLSDGNSDAKRFRREVQEQTGKMVYVAHAGLVMDFNKQPF